MSPGRRIIQPAELDHVHWSRDQCVHSHSSASSAIYPPLGLHIRDNQLWNPSMMSLDPMKIAPLEELGAVAALQSSSLPASTTMANRTRLEVRRAAVVYYPRIRIVGDMWGCSLLPCSFAQGYMIC